MRWRRETRILSLLLFGLTAAAGCDGGPPAPVSPDRATLSVEALEVRGLLGYSVRESYAGRVASQRSSDLGFDRSGRVVSLEVDEGDRVAEGDLLAALETRDLRAERRELRARQAAASARLELARRTTGRRQTLASSESISEQAYDEARFNEAALEAELEAANAGIARLGVTITLSELRAPFGGTVVMRSIDEGTVVTPGQAVLRLIESGPMELRVGLPLRTAEALDPDAVYPVEVEGLRFTARLDTCLPTVDAETRTVTTIFRFDSAQASGRLQDGALGRLEIETMREGEGFWLPLTALSEGRRGLWSAYAIEPDPDSSGDFVVERRDLQLIHVETDRVYVRGTLRDGDRIVSSGVHRIVPGQRVRAHDVALKRGDAGAAIPGSES